MYVVPAPLRPVMTFVNTDIQDQGLGAAFQQNSLQRVKVGDEAEVPFDAVPGSVFKGKVRTVLDAIAAGQIQASGCLVDFGARTEGGRPLAIIDLEEDISLLKRALMAVDVESFVLTLIQLKSAHAK